MLVSAFVHAYFVLAASTFSIPTLPHLSPFSGVAQAQRQQKPLYDTLDAWIEREEHISLDKLLANVAPGGRNVEGQGVANGTVVASPSTKEPDYWYQWVRDSAITMSSLVDIYADNPLSTLGSRLSSILDAYSELQYTIQRTPNPSGNFNDLSGLGEPKFRVDGNPFVGNWGRPQRDGPALRALTLIHYLREFNDSHPSIWSSSREADFFEPLYHSSMPPNSVIKADLEYVSHYWNESGFDLWEEVNGMHFFTLMVSARSLREGSHIAQAFRDDGAAEWYKEQGGYIEKLLTKFWNVNKGHLVETLWSKRTGLDCGLLLSSLHTLPSKISKDQPIFPPWSDEILMSLLALAQDQRQRFPINNSPSDTRHSSAFTGTGIGRYPEDVYDGHGTSSGGGNPWFLCTSSAAEVLYRTASHILETSTLTITPTSLPFYAALLASSNLNVAPGIYHPGAALFESIVERLTYSGDEFLEVVKAHVDAKGAMSEQFDRVTGYMRGAEDLTWSYQAFLGAARARKNIMKIL